MTIVKQCKCAGFIEGYAELAFYIQTMSLVIRSGGYQGPKWVFCPWCGEKMKGVKR